MASETRSGSKTLEPEAAVKFLVDRTGDADNLTAAELASELGYLPLALEQAGAYIEVVGGGFAEYLARYRRQGVALLAKGRPSTDYPKTVVTTWSLSFDTLRGASPASAELLTAAAFLAPDSVPIEIFTVGGSKLGDMLAQELNGAEEDPLVVWELLEPLERYSLIERLPDDAFKLHRLTQEVLKDSLSNAGRQAWADRVVQALSAAYPVVEFSNWSLCEKLQPSAKLAFELICTYTLNSTEARWLLTFAGLFALALGDLTGARKFQEQILEISLRVLGAEHPVALTSRNNLAETLRALGDLAGARKLNEQTLEISMRVLGAEHPVALTSRNNLALTLHALGDLAGARKLHQQSLEILEHALGAEHPKTLMSRTSLAATLYDLGDLANTRKLQEQTLEVQERVLGAEHPDTLLSTNNLALTLRALGDLAGARKLEEQTLAARERVLGGEHHYTLQSQNNLANTLYALGDLAGARKLLQQTLEVSERVLGAEHPDTTRSTWNLLRTVRQLNDADAEAELLSKLRWLLDRDEDSIVSADQRMIRRYLLDFLNPS